MEARASASDSADARLFEQQLGQEGQHVGGVSVILANRLQTD